MNKRYVRNILALLLAFTMIIGQFGQFVIAEEGPIDYKTDDSRTNAIRIFPEEVVKNNKIKLDTDLDSPEDIDIIVELKEKPMILQRLDSNLGGMARGSIEAKKLVIDSHKKLDSYLSTNNIDNLISVKNRYTEAFNGVAMTIAKDKLKELAESKDVKAIWEDLEVRLEPPVEFDGEIKNRMIQSSKHLGIDELHKEGIKGKGIKVGVLDTGIDYNHPDLKDVYKGGYDFVDEDESPMEATYKEWKTLNEKDPSKYPESKGGNAYYTSHGTHVSGTIAGQATNPEYPIRGISPEVELYVYRVLGPYGSGSESGILSAIEKSIDEGLDIINLSLGADFNYPLDPLSTSIDNATLGGMTCVISAGNIGPTDYTVGTPGTSALAITVGASDVVTEIPVFNISGDSGKEYKSKLIARNFDDSLLELEKNGYEIMDLGLGEEEDYLEKNVEGKFILIESGAITFFEKMLFAKEKGVKGIIVWNKDEPEIPSYYAENNNFRLTLAMESENARTLKNEISNGASPIIFNFNKGKSIEVGGDRLADFSSRGPTRVNYDIKPDIVAPGVFMLSTAPDFIGNFEEPNHDFAYQRMSGTSMAAPYTAGVAALIKQHNKDYKPCDVKTALMNTSVPLDKNGVFESGAGRIRPKEAVYSTVKFQIMDKTKTVTGIYPEEGEDINNHLQEVDDITGSISYGRQLGKDIDQSFDKRLKISNSGDSIKRFNTSVEYVNKLEGVEIDLPSSLSIEAGKEKDIKIVANVSASSEIGIHEGHIIFRNSEDTNEYYRMPFVIRITAEGIEYIEALSQAYNIGEPHPFRGAPWVDLVFKLSKEMEKVEIYLIDGETDKRIGFVRDFKAGNLEVDTEYLFQAFFGRYNPLTEDEDNPISSKLVEADEGYYKLEFIATDFDGNSYVEYEDLFVDKTPPELTLDFPEGVYELETNSDDPDGINWFKGQIYDSTIPLMQSKGYDIDYTTASIIYYENSAFMSGTLPVEADGSFKFGIAPEELADGKSINLKLFPIDYSTAGDFENQIQYFFVEKGSAYLTVEGDNNDLSLDDKLNASYGLKYVDSLSRLELVVNNMFNLLSIDKLEIHPDLQKLLDDQGIKGELIVEDGQTSSERKVIIDLDKKLEINKSDEDLKVIAAEFSCSMQGNKDFSLPFTAENIFYDDGNELKKEIKAGFFNLNIKAAGIKLENLEPSNDLDVEVGDEVAISFNGPTRGQATARILNLDKEVLAEIDIKEMFHAKYSGTWIVPEDLDGDIFIIEVDFKAPTGQVVKELTEGKIKLIKEEPEEAETPVEPGKPIDPGTPIKPVIPKEKPEEPKEEPEIENPKEAEIVELTDQEIEDILEDSFKDRKDIPSWAERAIGTLTDEKILSGRADGKFDPSANISRAEFLKLVVEALNLEKSSEKVKAFKDVKSSDWFKGYVDIGYSNGLASGISKDEFGPNLKISREDLSVMVYNAVKDLNLEADGKTNKDFKDEKEISGYAKEAVGELSKLGIVSGKGENKFAPKENATRAEAAVIIYRLIELMRK